MEYIFELKSDLIPWDCIEHCYDATVFHTEEWSNYLKNQYGLKPFVVEISKNASVVGYFLGYSFSRFGIRIIGSPFEGWATAYMGLVSKTQISNEIRIELYKELEVFCKKYAWYIQVSDWNIDYKDVEGLFNYTKIESYYLDLTPNMETLYRSFKQKSCQYSIKKAQKLGVIVSEPTNLNAFAEEYYNELIDVFAKQNLKPTYGVDCVKKLVNAMSPNHYVFLEARHPDTNVIMATIMFFYHNGMAFYWGASSYREYQKYCPNELLMFEAIRRMKDRGVTLLEMEGIRTYKEKYNPVRYSKPKIVFAKYHALITAKELAKKAYYKFRK